jgi:hypothetical protein
MNFLDLCQYAARESGTIATGQPSSVIGQSGRLGSVVHWVRQAWVDIQNHRNDWLWMVGEYDAGVIPGVDRYSAVDLAVPRFSRWMHEDGDGTPITTLYDPALGRADERRLGYLEWRQFYTTRLRGVTPPERPNLYSVDANRRITLSPTPDKAYRLRGLYRKAPQILTDNADIPEMPHEHHALIAWKALIYLATSDESSNQLPIWDLTVRAMMSNLERDQLPEMRVAGGALA